ncbi:hypothetical protein T06_66 [Trichinella sp. T6]|nr:hypothetical protein T06_66 [Trichinella sp. T6]
MPSSLYLLLPPVLASIRLLSPTLKTIPLRPTYRSSGGFAVADGCLSLLPMKSNYKLLVGTLKSKLNPKASQVAAFDEFQKAAFMIGESMRSFAHRLQLLLDHAYVTEDKMINAALLLRRFIPGLPKSIADI